MEDPICCCAENGMEEASISVSFRLSSPEADRFEGGANSSLGFEFTSYFGEEDLGHGEQFYLPIPHKMISLSAIDVKPRFSRYLRRVTKVCGGPSVSHLAVDMSAQVTAAGSS